MKKVLSPSRTSFYLVLKLIEMKAYRNEPSLAEKVRERLSAAKHTLRVLPSTTVRVLLFIPYSGCLFPGTGFAPTLSCPRCTPRIIRKPSISNPPGYGCVDLNTNVPSCLLDVAPGRSHRSRSASTAAQNTRHRAQTLIRVTWTFLAPRAVSVQKDATLHFL